MSAVPLKRILSQDNDGNLYLLPPELLGRFDNLLEIMATSNVFDKTHRNRGQVYQDEVATQMFDDEFTQYGLDNPPIELTIYAHDLPDKSYNH